MWRRTLSVLALWLGTFMSYSSKQLMDLCVITSIARRKANSVEPHQHSKWAWKVPLCVVTVSREEGTPNSVLWEHKSKSCALGEIWAAQQLKSLQEVLSTWASYTSAMEHRISYPGALDLGYPFLLYIGSWSTLNLLVVQGCLAGSCVYKLLVPHRVYQGPVTHPLCSLWRQIQVRVHH